MHDDPSFSLPVASAPHRIRPRRLRRGPVLREAVAETVVTPSHLMAPVFVLDDETRTAAVQSMPGVERLGYEPLVRWAERHLQLGVNKVLLFGVPQPEHKDDTARAARDAKGVVPSAIRRLKQAFGDDLLIATDVCLCGYTRHGHCGVLQDGVIVNDLSLPLLSEMAVRHAQAGADMVAPSDMMDGRIGALRDALDAAGHVDTALMSYSVKYASSYYGPFREAADSAPQQGDRRSYQMDVRNRREALREAKLDVREGADWLMVKPALAFLDVIADVRANFNQPLACYNVSGEYSMVKFAARAGAIDEAGVVRENLVAMRRAGADLIITYHAQEAAQHGWLSP